MSFPKKRKLQGLVMEQKSFNGNSSKSAATGFVDIVEISRTFYTTTYGAPDMLCPLLLSSAREAFAATAGDAQQKVNAPPFRRAATYMAGLLLADETFMPGQASELRGHRYRFNFTTGTMTLHTHLFITSKEHTSVFNIRIEGSILEGRFVVRNASTDELLARLSEEDLHKPNFFAHELPFVCSQPENDLRLTSSTNPFSLVGQCIDIQLPVDQGGEVKMVRVTKGKGEPQGRAQDGETGEFLFPIPLQYFNNLSVLQETLPIILAQRTKPLVRIKKIGSLTSS